MKYFQLQRLELKSIISIVTLVSLISCSHKTQGAEPQLPLQKQEIIDFAEALNALAKVCGGLTGDDATYYMAETVDSIYSEMKIEENINKLYAQSYLMQGYIAAGLNYVYSMIGLYGDKSGIAAAAYHGSSHIDSLYNDLENDNFNNLIQIMDFAQFSTIQMSYFTELYAMVNQTELNATGFGMYSYCRSALESEEFSTQPIAFRLQFANVVESIVFFKSYFFPIVLYLHPDKRDEYQSIIFDAATQIDKGYSYFSSYIEDGQDLDAMSKDDFATYMHETIQQKINLIKLLTEIWTCYTKEAPSQIQMIFGSGE